jgi:hypothetical protein
MSHPTTMARSEIVVMPHYRASQAGISGLQQTRPCHEPVKRSVNWFLDSREIGAFRRAKSPRSYGMGNVASTHANSLGT